MADPGYGRREFLRKMLAFGLFSAAGPSLVLMRPFDSKDFAWKELAGRVVMTPKTIRGGGGYSLKDADRLLKEMYLPHIRRQMEQEGVLLKMLRGGPVGRATAP